jgi:long-subunit fatty acid transport protein
MKHHILFAFLLAAGVAWAQDQQVGARTKAMGGSYTAFEDDPVSVWLNPAGIATQPDSLAISYQTYTSYELELSSATLVGVDPAVPPEAGWSDPALIPSYLGVVLQVGTPEHPQAFGFCFVSPYQLKFPFSSIADDDIPNTNFQQTFYRFRVAFAKDFRLKPPGAEGALTHVAVGIGVDYSITRVDFEELTPELFSDALSLELTDTGAGGGAGLLVGLFDNTRTFKVNLGAAYQSQVHYDASVTSTIVPQFKWPNQYQLGATFYFLEGLPLRVTVDAQRIEWDGATKDSTRTDADDFKDVTNLSLGVEYRIKVPSLFETVAFYPRLGLRSYDAPWDGTGRNEMPAIRQRRMIIDTHDDEFVIWSGGLGVGWASESGKARSIDLAFDHSSDATGLAIGFSLEF